MHEYVISRSGVWKTNEDICLISVIGFCYCSPGDLDILVKQVRAQLKKIAITDKTRVDEMFLRYNKDRSGFIDAANMRNLCRSLQLPVDDDVIAAVRIYLDASNLV